MNHINPYEDDDIEIPNEFLMKPHATTKSDAAGTTVSRIHQQQEDCVSMLQKSMPLDDPAKYKTVSENDIHTTQRKD